MKTPLTLKEVRKGMLGWTQEQLACELGLTRRTIVRYEADGAPVRVLKAVSHILKANQRKTPKRQPLQTLQA
jgi:DNA-binding XRE family transcriptional regulator